MRESKVVLVLEEVRYVFRLRTSVLVSFRGSKSNDDMSINLDDEEQAERVMEIILSGLKTLS